jgi:hypothetical protein
MSTPTSLTVEAFGAMGRQEKLEQLRSLCDLVWDIEEDWRRPRPPGPV